MKCPLCNKSDFSLIYNVKNIPLFQNKTYMTMASARNAQTADVKLIFCHHCGFIFNANFDANTMDYDDQYQNEQSHSFYFQNYLDEIIDLFLARNFRKKKIVEIGCGKGYFLEKLRKNGFNVTGFDPAYEGDSPYIIKDYFSDKYSDVNSDLIVLRHTLEHIQNPLRFLHSIGSAVGYRGMMYIEVPDFRWILKKKAFWDIYYEHCNYFSLESLGSIFQKSERGSLFSNQYMYLLSDLSGLREQAKPNTTSHSFNLSSPQLKRQLNFYQGFVKDHPGMLVWGAGAKGSTFVNLTDVNKEYISCLVDINPKKQGRYIAKTGHKIISPAQLADFGGERDILVMNDNYYQEIQELIKGKHFNLYRFGAIR
jgi:SAM-dependent methyltransferase